MRIVFHFSELPPSSNKIYYNQGKGRGILAAASAYKNRFTLELNRHLVNLLMGSLDPDGQYEVRLLFLMSGVQNKGWPKKAARRFKKMDVDNRVKLLWDGISNAIGVDDRNNFILQAYKAPVATKEEEGVLVLIQQIDEVTLEYLLGLFLVDVDGQVDSGEYNDILRQLGRL